MPTSLLTLAPISSDSDQPASGPLGPNDTIATQADLDDAIAALEALANGTATDAHIAFFGGAAPTETVTFALQQALGQVGYKSPGNDNQHSAYNDWYVAQGYGTYFRDCAWCAIFQCWNGRQGSIPAAHRTAGALALVNQFGRIPVAQPGAMIGYTGKNYPDGHVEIVVRPDADPNYVWTVGGNTTGGGQGVIGVYYIRRYKPGNVYGYSMPGYSVAPAPAPAPTPPAPGQLVEDGDFGPKTIERLQQVLNAHGLHTVVDGNFGPDTKGDLQQYLHVTRDGNIGPVTIRALQAHVGAAQDGVWGTVTTRDLQIALNANRF